MNEQEYKEGEQNDFAESELSTAKNMMYHDTPLTPKMISSLMHVDTKLQSAYLHEVEESQKGTKSFLYAIGVIVSSILVALIVGTSFLYFHGSGPFYDPLEASAL